MIKVEFAHVGQDALVLIELPVEGVLGQGHDLLLHVGLVVLAHGLHQPLAHRGLARGGAARHADHERSLHCQRHLAGTGDTNLIGFCHFCKQEYLIVDLGCR